MIEQQVNKYRRACGTRNVGQDAACVQEANTITSHGLSATGFLALVIDVKVLAFVNNYLLPCRR